MTRREVIHLLTGFWPLLLFVGLYIVPGLVLGLMDLFAFMTGHAPRVPYVAPSWPAGS